MAPHRAAAGIPLALPPSQTPRAPSVEAPPAPFIDRGEPLPRSYAVNRLIALVRDPEGIFCYWDVESEVRVAGYPLMLRVHSVSEGRSWDVDLGVAADNWYFRVTPNRTYRFELCEKRPTGLRVLAASAEVTTPVRWGGESGVHPPEELLMAIAHPISRTTAGVQRSRTAAAVRPAVRQRMLPASAAAQAAASPRAPLSIAPPFERTFGADYTRTRK